MHNSEFDFGEAQNPKVDDAVGLKFLTVSCAGLGAAQKGVLLRLALEMVIQEGPIHFDKAALYEMCGIHSTSDREAFESVLERFFFLDECGMLSNKDALAEVRLRKGLAQMHKQDVDLAQMDQSVSVSREKSSSNLQADPLELVQLYKGCFPEGKRILGELSSNRGLEAKKTWNLVVKSYGLKRREDVIDLFKEVIGAHNLLGYAVGLSDIPKMGFESFFSARHIQKRLETAMDVLTKVNLGGRLTQIVEKTTTDRSRVTSQEDFSIQINVIETRKLLAIAQKGLVKLGSNAVRADIVNTPIRGGKEQIDSKNGLFESGKVECSSSLIPIHGNVFKKNGFERVGLDEIESAGYCTWIEMPVEVKQKLLEAIDSLESEADLMLRVCQENIDRQRSSQGFVSKETLFQHSFYKEGSQAVHWLKQRFPEGIPSWAMGYDKIRSKYLKAFSKYPLVHLEQGGKLKIDLRDSGQVKQESVG